MYADDLNILCENASSLNEALAVCSEYGSKNDIKYNANKTTFMIFGTKQQRLQRPTIKMSGLRLERSTKVKLLGRIFDETLREDDHLGQRSKKTFGAYHNLTKIGINSKKASYKYKVGLFKIFCRPILHYGAESLKMTQKIRKRMTTIEGGLVKRSIGLINLSGNKILMEALNFELLYNIVYMVGYLNKYLKISIDLTITRIQFEYLKST